MYSRHSTEVGWILLKSSLPLCNRNTCPLSCDSPAPPSRFLLSTDVGFDHMICLSQRDRRRRGVGRDFKCACNSVAWLPVLHHCPGKSTPLGDAGPTTELCGADLNPDPSPAKPRTAQQNHSWLIGPNAWCCMPVTLELLVIRHHFSRHLPGTWSDRGRKDLLQHRHCARHLALLLATQ